MKEISFEESKDLLLKILVNVDEFCNQHDIKYSLAFGTLIGAIRHKGFIPWDDDIDIIMRRDDYERFVNSFGSNRYKVIDGKYNPNHSHIRVSDQKTILKMGEWRGQFYKEGLWIDVFPLDKVPDSQKKYLRFKKLLWFLFEIQLTGEVDRKGTFNKMIHIICKPFSPFFGKLALRTMKKYNGCDTQSVSNLSGWYLKTPKFPDRYMEEYVDVEFEGHTFKAIKEYDSFLRENYGDYMQLPPKEQQKSHHSYTAYWRD